jgi:hypothetical protein
MMDAQMLGTILGGIVGFIAAVLPNVFARMQEVLDHKKTMDIGAQQIEAARAGVTTARLQARLWTNLHKSTRNGPPTRPLTTRKRKNPRTGCRALWHPCV